MKRLHKLALILLASITIFSSCEQTPTAEPKHENHSITLNATLHPTTKTHLGEFNGSAYPMLWDEEGESVSLIEWGYEGTPESIESQTSLISAVPSQVTTIYNAGANATFQFNLDDADADFYDYATVYSGAGYSVEGDREDGNTILTLSIPAEQSPTEGQFDKEATTLVAYSADHTERATMLSMNFKHIGAYAILNIENIGIGDGEQISSVTITSGEHSLAGKIGYDYLSDKTELPTTDVENSVTIKTDHLSLSNTGGMELFFVTHPTEFVEGDTLSFIVTTDENTYTKSVTISAESKFSFARGEILKFSVDFTTIEADTQPTTCYEWVTGVEDLKVGDQIILVVAPSDVTNNYIAAAPLSFNSLTSVELKTEILSAPAEQLYLTDENVEIFTLNQSFSSVLEMKWTLTGSGTNNTLGAVSTSSDNVNYSNSSNNIDLKLWDISINYGTAKIENVGSEGRYLMYSPDNRTFKAYREGDAYIHPYIYRKVKEE